MEKTVITGRIFERILEKSGYTKSGYARFLSTELKTKRTRQWVSKLILSNPHDEIPARWVNALKEMVGEEAFEKWKGGQSQGLNDRPATVQLTQAETERRLEAVRQRFAKAAIPERLELLDSLPYEG
jgi:hypothetical protein